YGCVAGRCIPIQLVVDVSDGTGAAAPENPENGELGVGGSGRVVLNHRRPPSFYAAMYTKFFVSSTKCFVDLVGEEEDGSGQGGAQGLGMIVVVEQRRAPGQQVGVAAGEVFANPVPLLVHPLTGW